MPQSDDEIIDSVERGFIEAYQKHRAAVGNVLVTSRTPDSLAHRLALKNVKETERVLNLSRQQMGVLYG